jgi:hypothetical protein
MTNMLVVFIVGLLCGIVTSVTLFGVSFVLIAGKVNAKEWEPSLPLAQNRKNKMEFFRQQAQMQNFWAYDGTVQKNADEIAQDLYDKQAAGRPKNMP